MRRWIWQLFAVAMIMTVQVSAYTPYECGGNISAIGKPCKEGRTCAFNGVPFGTIIEWRGKHYIVEDRCGFDNVLDIFMESHSEAIKFGRKFNQVIRVYLP